jgi:hypothetical protein
LSPATSFEFEPQLLIELWLSFSVTIPLEPSNIHPDSNRSEVQRANALTAANQPLKPGEKRKRLTPHQQKQQLQLQQQAQLTQQQRDRMTEAMGGTALTALKGSAIVYANSQWETEVGVE